MFQILFRGSGKKDRPDCSEYQIQDPGSVTWRVCIWVQWSSFPLLFAALSPQKRSVENLKTKNWAEHTVVIQQSLLLACTFSSSSSCSFFEAPSALLSFSGMWKEDQTVLIAESLWMLCPGLLQTKAGRTERPQMDMVSSSAWSTSRTTTVTLLQNVLWGNEDELSYFWRNSWHDDIEKIFVCTCSYGEHGVHHHGDQKKGEMLVRVNLKLF